MLENDRFLVLFMLATTAHASLDTMTYYNPLLDNDGYSSDDVTIVMTNGRPDMRILEDLLEYQDAGEDEGYQETDPPLEEMSMDSLKGMQPEDLNPGESDTEADSENLLVDPAELGSKEVAPWQQHHSPSTNQENRLSSNRRKRFVINNQNKLWDHGILPYTLDDTLSDKQRNQILNVVIPKYEYWTHFRFVPWNSTVRTMYRLTHNNYLVFVSQNGCWSLVGNMRKQSGGQKISCCGGNACVHEIGHAIGFYHEQTNPLGRDYIRVNRENILDGKISNFNIKSLQGNRVFGYFDLSSLMEYGSKAFSKNKEETISVLDPELLYLIKHQDSTAFYMFYEAETLYQMKAQKCPGFPILCINGGYVSFINNKCQCRCTRGMNPDTGCATPINADIWPIGSYSLLKPVSGCPAGFIQGEIRLWKSNATQQQTFYTSSTYHAAGNFSKKYISLTFCTKTYQHFPGTVPQWGQGHYCVFRYGSKCPAGFNFSQSQFGEADMFNRLSHFGTVPELQFNKTLYMLLCCRGDGHQDKSITLPKQKPVMLPKGDNSCQPVTNMRVQEEEFRWRGEDTAESGGIMLSCFYTPDSVEMTSPCGNMIFLSDINSIQTISSPLYPSQYTAGQQCSWFFKAPEGSKLVLNFEDFAIYKGRGCNGHLEIRYMLPGQPGMLYCGEGFDKTIVSHTNTLSLILSDPRSSTSKKPHFLVDSIATNTDNSNRQMARRFRAIVALLREKDLCYTRQGKDGSYQGLVNCSNTFEKCLPWDRVTHCQHHVFRDQDFALEGNYCRNPGSGTEPWCYTDSETCARSYCDVCQIRNCYDLFEDCSQLLSANSNYCSEDPEAMRGCRQTCHLCHSVPNPALVSEQICSKPDPVIDGVPTSSLKSSYCVGEKVTYSCRTNYALKQSKVCTSEGKWSSLTYVCEGCPSGWSESNGNCYKLGIGLMTKMSAAKTCRNMQSGAILTTAESEPENRFLCQTSGNKKIWLGGYNRFANNTNQLVWDNQQPVSWTNWLTGKPWPQTGNKRCLIMLPNTKWDNINCGLRKNYVCRCPVTVPSVCADQRADCQSLLERNPTMCVRYRGFTKRNCARTCNICSSNQTVLDSRNSVQVVTCQVTGQPVNATLVTRNQPIKSGGFVKYKCNHGYQLVTGSLVRACLLSGNLTGEVPHCLDEDDTFTVSNKIGIRRRHRIGQSHSTYIMAQSELTINRTGEITAWQFYSNYAGTVGLQVWRRTGTHDRHMLHGQNIITNTRNNRRVTADITAGSRITVQPGDLIGLYYPRANRGGISYDDCDVHYTPTGGNQLQVTAKVNRVQDWKVGSQYNTSPWAGCRVFSLKAIIGPARQ